MHSQDILGMCREIKHNRQQAIQTFIWHLYLVVWTTATHFCMEVTDNVIRRVQSLQNAAARLITGARRRDHITPVLCQLDNYTGFLFGGEWSSNLPAWWARRCAVKCLPTWLMTSISSPKATDNPFGLPLITCVVPHTLVTALETETLALSARKFGTVCHVTCRHLTSPPNILKRCWTRICFNKATVLCGILHCESKKLCHFYFYCNFGKCWSIFKICSMSESERNGS